MTMLNIKALILESKKNKDPKRLNKLARKFTKRKKKQFRK